MLRRGPQAGARHGANDEGNARLAAEHVTQLGGLIEQRIEGHADEVHEHQLDDRPQAGGGGADGDAHEAHLADRRVAHAIGTEGLVQAARHSHDSTPGLRDALFLASAAARDVLAEQDHVGIRGQSDVQGLVDRLMQGDDAAHGRYLT